MPNFKSTRHAFATVKEVIADSKTGQALYQAQFPSDLGQYKFLMQFSKYKFVSGRDGNFEKVETNKSIALPLPTSLLQDYSLNISADLEIGAIQQGGVRALQTALEGDVRDGDGKGILDTYFQGLIGTAEEGARNSDEGDAGQGVRPGIQGLAKLVPKMGAAGLAAGKAFATIAPKNMISAIEAGLGNIFNPVLAAAFKGPNLRTHVFEWRVVPRNAQESKSLNNIIRKIRTAIHPSLTALVYDDGNIAMEYPEIVTCALLMPDNDQNIFYKPALVSSFTVDHNEGGLAFFQNTGNPVSYKIKMTMTELDVITKEDFKALESDEGTEG